MEELLGGWLTKTGNKGMKGEQRHRQEAFVQYPAIGLYDEG